MRTTILIACCLAFTLPAAADLTIGAGLDIGTSGTFDGVTVLTFRLADIGAFTVGPLAISPSQAVAIATTRDFSDAYLGVGLQRGIAVLSGGYDTGLEAWGARLTVLGVRF
jgi:hypothetical protein